jgi:mannosyltransferase OCH1-like enzyme
MISTGLPSDGANLIPKILHTIWLGKQPMPADQATWIEGWISNHPGWRHLHWTDSNLPTLSHPHLFYSASKPAQKADILRIEVICRHGGVYIDTDMECLRCIEPIIEGAQAFVGNELPGRPSQAVLGAVANHPFFYYMLSQLPSRAPYSGDILSETGPVFLNDMLKKYFGEFARGQVVVVDGTSKRAAMLLPGNFLLFEPWIFFPYYLGEAWHPECHPDSFAAHHWAGSWFDLPQSTQR